MVSTQVYVKAMFPTGTVVAGSESDEAIQFGEFLNSSLALAMAIA
jgi:hypothetical protein